jgi:hypothetical protein
MGAFEVEKQRVVRKGGGEWWPPGEHEEPPLIEFTVAVSDFPDVVIEMTYSLQGRIALRSVKISSVAYESKEDAGSVSPGVVRNLPLATLDRSLAMRVLSVLSHPAYRDVYRALPGMPRPKGNYLPAAAVEELYPGLAEDETKAGKRRYSSLMRLAEITRLYADMILEGEKGATGVIAAMEGVQPVTVRSWLHRAKAAGFYPYFGLEKS